MIHYIETLLWRIKNTFKWIKFIWGFKWYEYGQIYQIMRFSLQNTIEYFEGSKIYYLGMDRDLYYMRLCVKLIDRIESDYYEERAFEEIEKRWGKNNFITENLNDGGLEMYSLKMKRELEKTEEDSKRYRDEYMLIRQFWNLKHEKAKRLLYRILQEKMEGWWI